MNRTTYFLACAIAATWCVLLNLAPGKANADGVTIEGRWQLTGVAAGDYRAPTRSAKLPVKLVEVGGSTWIESASPGSKPLKAFVYKIDYSTSPARIDLVTTGRELGGNPVVCRGLCIVDKTTMKLWIGPPNGPRPENAASSDEILEYEYTRQ